MAASNAHLPSIGTLDVSADGKGNKKGGAAPRMQANRSSKRAASSFLSRLHLGSLRPSPRPGDTYHGPVSSRHRRPLGLLPEHNDRLTALKKLNQLLSPWTLGQRPAVPLPPPPVPSDPQLNATWPPAHSEVSEDADAAISASMHLKTNSHAPLVLNTALSSGAEPRPNHREKDGTAYRLTHQGLSEPVPHVCGGKRDPDYMGDRVREYYAMIDMAPMPGCKTTQVEHLNTSTKGEKKKAKLKRHDHAPISNVRYLNFTGQAQLFERVWTDDKRSALDYEPCERCRLRGTRCSRCKAIRTGGGYIILDAGDNPDAVLGKRRGFDFWSGGHGVTSGGGGAKGGMRAEGLVGADEDGRGWGGGEGGEGGEGGVRRGGTGVGGVGGGVWGEGEGEEGRGGWGAGAGGRAGEGVGQETGGGGLVRSGTQAQRHQNRSKEEGRAGGEEGTYTGPASSHVSGKQRSLEDGADEGGVSTGDEGGRRGGDLGEREQWEKSGRDSHGSRSASRAGRISRPGSTLGPRPGSSLRGAGRGSKGGRGEGMDGHGKRSKGGTRREGLGGGDDENDGRRRGRKPSARDGEGRGRGEYEGSGYMHRRDDEDEERGGYRGNLMKFKRKRDDVKALHATLKELQGIDPLDYLAKYCIIDQTKLPHYQHVFNNVDRDEDDEINIGELDFALKAVNYDLISDAEMNYVHSVLELAGRYSLNFRLFSLIAALSEKVVALEDMVKRLINKMDFDALEVKMKKCKELFYLLADSDAPLEHEGGVVTTSSLAVELQAGGLTQEHVEFVVDRLNHEGKGLVEFLDYLTYVPLFVEIHDAISGNPLDFSRTK